MAKGFVGRPLALAATALGAGLLGQALYRRLRATDLRGQVVLITGGSRGLGYALAREFGRQGAKLVICARNWEPLERARRELEEMGSEVLAVPCDVADREQVERLVHNATNRFGRVDILVNNAGIITAGPLQTLSLKDFEESMDIMLWGPVYATLVVLPQMRARGSGQIVNITSVGGKVSVPHLVAYTTAKFAAVGFSEGLHAELAQDGITVTTVAPGLMRTGSHVNAFAKGNKHREEYTLFSLLATSPFSAISVERAARQIVEATKQRRPELIISLQAQTLARFHGLFPGLSSTILGGVNRLLPQGSGKGRYTGKESETPISNSFLTALGERSAHKYHQYAPGEERADPQADSE